MVATMSSFTNGAVHRTVKLQDRHHFLPECCAYSQNAILNLPSGCGFSCLHGITVIHEKHGTRSIYQYVEKGTLLLHGRCSTKMWHSHLRLRLQWITWLLLLSVSMLVNKKNYKFRKHFLPLVAALSNMTGRGTRGGLNEERMPEGKGHIRVVYATKRIARLKTVIWDSSSSPRRVKMLNDMYSLPIRTYGIKPPFSYYSM